MSRNVHKVGVTTVCAKKRSMGNTLLWWCSWRWFLGITLRILTTYDFYVISVRLRARVHVYNIWDARQAKRKGETNCSFSLKWERRPIYFTALFRCTKLTGFNYHRFCWYATLENKTLAETFPKFPSILRVIDMSDRNPRITATSATFSTSRLRAVIGGFRSDMSITRKIDGNFGNVSASVLFSKVEYQRKRR